MKSTLFRKIIVIRLTFKIKVYFQIFSFTAKKMRKDITDWLKAQIK